MDRLLDALEAENWCFKAKVVDFFSENGISTLESARNAVLNLDLTHYGKPVLSADFLNERTTRMSRNFILQIVSVVDISRPSTATGDSAVNSNRILRLKMTDGKKTVTGIEFETIPILSLDIPPGTKVILSDVPVRNGIFLLGPKNIKVLGGKVSPLFENWEMERKYSKLARSALKSALANPQGSGPPPFQTVTAGRLKAEQSRKSAEENGHSKGSMGKTNTKANFATNNDKIKPGLEPSLPKNRIFEQRNKTVHIPVQEGPQIESGTEKWAIKAISKELSPLELNLKPHSSSGEINKAAFDEGPNVDEQQKRTVSELPGTVSFQNQSMSQKLLEKQTVTGRRGAGRRGRGVWGHRSSDSDGGMTLEEWERKKLERKMAESAPPLSDEELARQLQEQLDMEDSLAMSRENGSASEPAENLLQSMFSYSGSNSQLSGESAFGHGRGRGRRGRGSQRRGN